MHTVLPRATLPGMDRTPLLFLIVILLAMPPLTAAADDATSRWVPGLAVTGGVRSIDRKASVSSVRGDVDSESRALFGFLGADLQLATPAFEAGPVPIRIFVRGGVATSFDGEEEIANEGAPGSVVIPIRDINRDGIPDGDTPIGAIEGIGSATAAQSEAAIWTAGLGLDLGIPIFDRVLHVKPSVEWILQSDRARALFGFAEEFPIVGRELECPCRTISAIAQESQTYHGLGPGLELELEASRLGDLLLTVFASGQAYYNFDREIEIRATGTSDDGSRTETLLSIYERDRFDYRAAWGFRVHWLPE